MLAAGVTLPRATKPASSPYANAPLSERGVAVERAGRWAALRGYGAPPPYINWQPLMLKFTVTVLADVSPEYGIGPSPLQLV